MPRSKQTKKRQIAPDPIYASRLVAKLITVTMYDGKKSVSQKHIYKTLEQLKAKTKEEALGILRQALDNIKPVMEVRSRRVGGAAGGTGCCWGRCNAVQHYDQPNHLAPGDGIHHQQHWQRDDWDIHI